MARKKKEPELKKNIDTAHVEGLRAEVLEQPITDTLTDRLENTLTDAGGEMDVSYSVAIENETAGHIDYHIHVRPQEA